MTVRIGIAGPGGVARTHALAIKGIPEAQLTAVYSHREESARRFAKEFGIPWFTDFSRFLEHIDVLDLCTPHHVRSELILPAATKGKHILVEKPLAISLEEADEIIKVCNEAKVKLGVIFQSRFEEDIQLLNNYLKEGKLGKPLAFSGYVKWYRDPEYYTGWHGKQATEGGGVLINQAIHMLDLIRWLGGEVTDVIAMTARLLHHIEVEDTTFIILRFDSGAVGSLEASTALYPGYPMRLEVHTDLGTVILEENEVIQVDLREQGLVTSLFPSIGKKTSFVRTASPTEIKILPHQRQIQDFVRAILEDKRPAVDGYEARKTLELVLEIYKKAKRFEREVRAES